MKRDFLFAAPLCVATALLCSCGSDADPSAEGGLLDGATTYMALNITQGSGSRADATVAGSGEENALGTSVDVYIFNNGIFEQSKTVGFTGGSQTDAIQTVVGEKVVYVVVGSASFVAPTSGETTIGEFEKSLFSSPTSTIAPASGAFTMFGRSDAKLVVQSTEAEAATKNNYPVTVHRAAAKAQLKFDATDPEESASAKRLNATFSGAKFAIGQSALQMYVGPTQALYNSNLTANGEYTPTGDTPETSGTYPNYTDFTTNAPEFKDAVTTFNNDRLTTGYMAENYTETPVTGNTTFMLIKLTATPKKYQDGTTATAGADFWVYARHDSEHGTYIFLTDESYNMLYFPSETAAEDYATSKNLPVKSETDTDGYELLKYTNGDAYYRVNIKNAPESSSLSQKYSVQRNSFYQVTVNSVNNLGAPDAGGVIPDNPDEPLDPDYWLVTTIDVADWTIVSQGADL